MIPAATMNERLFPRDTLPTRHRSRWDNLPAFQLLLSTAFFLAVLLTTPLSSARDRIEHSQVLMGTKFIISVDAEDSKDLRAAMTEALERVAKLDQIFSDYQSDSEVIQLCSSAPHDCPVRVSTELFHVLATANSLSHRTGGAFDVTVGPLSKLWRRARRRKQFPTAEQLARARAPVGFRAMELNAERKTVQLTKPDMRIDLGAIAKGYAADEALRVLKESGFPRALVNAGGDIVVGDAPNGQAGWKIGIAPLEPTAPPSRVLRIANRAIATSGDAWQYVELDGKRYSHIIDPRSGMPLTERSSVTVIARTGIEADSLASAISVLGRDKGLKLAQQSMDVSTLVLYVVDGETRELKSQHFPNAAE